MHDRSYKRIGADKLIKEKKGELKLVLWTRNDAFYISVNSQPSQSNVVLVTAIFGNITCLIRTNRWCSV